MVIVKSGKKALAVGILIFILSNALARLTTFVLKHFLSLDKEISSVLPHVAMLLSMTSFPVVACFLDEFEILNSDIGRLACSSSMVCEICFWSVVSFRFALRSFEEMSPETSLGFFLSNGFLMSLIVFGIRPGALWVVQNSPEGKPVKEIYIYAVFVALLICGLLGEATGLTAVSTSFVLGLVIPDGPPLGAALTDMLDCFVSVLLMPIFFIACGLRMNVFSIQNLENVGVIHLVVFVSLVGKVVGSIVPSLLCRMPFRDALTLGLIMNCKGTIELVILISWKVQNVMNDESFTIMIVSLILETGFISPLIKAIYNPSRKFLAYKRRTILHLRDDEELRILACIHGLENAQAILDLLLVSNPTHQSHINLIVLHHIKLAGRSSPLLIAHQPRERSFSYKTLSEQIFSAFRRLEGHFSDRIVITCYKGISPYPTMYNDVCSLALDKRTTFIVIPFHRQRMVGEGLKSSHAMRQLNNNVLEKAPCTVGVLIDNGNVRSSHNFSRLAFHRVVVLFFGGADDREALAFATRVSEQDRIMVTLFHFSSSEEIVGSTARGKMLDTKLLSEFKLKTSQNNRISCQDKMVMDGGDLISVLKSLQNAYDLVIIGRRHAESWLMSDIRKSNERQGDLGAVGDFLASFNHESGTSILVVQQQTRLWGLRDPEDSTHLRRVKI
ncbi:cation/H(+) antiporter 15-like isoform X1 [Cucumis melo var. makuwa]|uniref:Cation/H(+) antiporter 15-like isoform X1 n=1 Tax=Cucumis melo var. makuwa TaxID=1194695 RepID=A0A5A7UZ64_CUCMM|nr:cation/H(+) antiporter 15-like isoform X1 [Cucumis melo var. makuwa]TYK07591.1 cation/H(+) antiporter 15-like isoform X1 [Cucumis melo var. makuwa]